ncbi:MAG: hypothetical protein M3O70_24505 [Actinomycetota bacterium]|nr:hypothetical protein [Actinomycetota bacterium]
MEVQPGRGRPELQDREIEWPYADGSILLEDGLSWEEARQLAEAFPRRLPVA